MEAVSARLGADDMTQIRAASLPERALTPALVTVTITGLAAFFGVVGADARWLAALGGVIWSHHSIPPGIPFASAATTHWSNAIVLAELIFHGLESALGDRGLMLAQLMAVAIAMVVLARDALGGGATRQGMTAALIVAAVGALPDLSVVRLQLFSIALFPLATAVLRAEARHPSRRIWLMVPLLATWSNLHGTVLLGLGMTLVYLAFVRFRQDPGAAVAVGLAASLAICATPAGIHTLAYYQGVLTNEAAQRGQGLWAPLSLTAPLDVVLVAAAIALGARLRRSSPQLWELIVLGALSLMTIKAGRSGVWLLFFLAPLAARTFKPRERWDRFLPPLATVGLVVLLVAVARGPLPNGASRSLLNRAIALSHGTPMLAEDVFSEQIALAGGRIWVGNPIDAFSKRDQAAYLDWLQGAHSGVKALASNIDVVLTGRGDRPERLMSGDRAFRLVALDRNAALFLRRPARVTP
jgi:hypothetical protein